MTAHEVILILLATGVLYLVLAFRDTFSVRNFLLVLCVVPALFLAVEGATEVVTCDEIYMLSEITDFQSMTSRQWKGENYHTSIAITGTIVNALRRLLAADDIQAKIIAKAVHWFLGLVSLAGIFWIISRRWIPPNLIPGHFLIYFYGALLLPTNVLSLKVANYDMFAMLLSLWGLLCCLVGCEEVKRFSSLGKTNLPNAGHAWRSRLSEVLLPDGGLSLFGIVLTTLAAQEKQIAGPFLNLAIVLSVLMRLRRRGRIDWWLPLQIGISSLVMFLVLLLTHGVVALWHPPNQPSLDLSSVLTGLFLHFDIVFRALGIPARNVSIHIGALLMTVVLTSLLIWWLRTRIDKIEAAVRLAFPLLLIIAVLIGVCGFYKVEAYVHPIYPIPEGNFVPKDEMNGEIIHFLSGTHLGHMIRKSAFAYSIFAISVPTAFVLVAILVLGCSIWGKRREVKRSLWAFQVLGVLSSAMPLVYVLTSTPVGTRYFNVWVFLEALLLGSLGCLLLETFSRPAMRGLAVGAFCLVLLAEVFPFRPVLGAFWPWWANASGLQTAATITAGKIPPIWPGWGEEAMIAGRQLRKMASSRQLPSASFRLFTVYPGGWLVRDQETYWVSTAPYLSFTENDYYVINRAAIVQRRFRFPIDGQPIWTITFRGVVQARVFRGSTLKNSP